MNTSATLEGLEANLRTWSAVNTYLEKCPDVTDMRGKGAEGDVVDRVISKLKDMLKGEGVPGDSTISVGMVFALLLYRKPSA